MFIATNAHYGFVRFDVGFEPTTQGSWLVWQTNLTKQNATSTFTVSYSATHSHKTYYSYIIAYLI